MPNNPPNTLVKCSLFLQFYKCGNWGSKRLISSWLSWNFSPGVCVCVCVCVCVIPEVDDDDLGWSWLYWGKIFKSSLVGGRGGFLEERTSKMTFGQWVGICQVGHGELHFRQRDSREAGKGKAGGRAWSFRWASPEFLLATDTVQSIIPLPWFAEMLGG